ncbi:hypothetical protein MCBG_00498 [Micromonospora sp. M42]|nr:hypothetical protein MCBG_00498 [Micromonospora sp. M42]
MERVAFLVDESGTRVDCLLNPETVQVTRLAGVRPRGGPDGPLTGAGLADDPLVFTGGGRTELVLDLLFDVDFVESPARPEDVRTLTRPLWMLAENSAVEHGWLRPPLVRLVWGKTWNVPGVITAIAGRFDAFTLPVTPRRSWLRLKLVPSEARRRRAPGSRRNWPRRAHPLSRPGPRWSPPPTARPSRAGPGCASTCSPTTRWARRCAGGCSPSTTGSPTRSPCPPAPRSPSRRPAPPPSRRTPSPREARRDPPRDQPGAASGRRGCAVSRAALVTVDGRPLADPARLRGIRVAARLDRPAQCELTLATAPGAGPLDSGTPRRHSRRPPRRAGGGAVHRRGDSSRAGVRR